MRSHLSVACSGYFNFSRNPLLVEYWFGGRTHRRLACTLAASSEKATWIHVRDSQWGYLHKGIVHSVVIGMEVIVYVIDNSKNRGSVGICTLEAFANGNRVFIERRAGSSAEADWIVRRAESQLRTRYDLLIWNCQHFVNWVLSGMPRLVAA